LIETSEERLGNAILLAEKYHYDDIDYVICVYDGNDELIEYVNGHAVGFYDHHYGGKPWLSNESW
jgi:hypothetical protein